MKKYAVLFASVAVLAACGGAGDGALTGGLETAKPLAVAMQAVLPTGANDTAESAMTLGMNCSEVMGFFPVDYAIARSLVPAEYELLQLSTGQALLTMPIQNCGGLVLNGSEVAPAPFVHFWIQVTGPEAYVEVVPGAVAKRDYYYSVFEHTTASNPARQPVKQLGFEGAPIESMTLGDVVPTPNGYSVRSGGVVEKALGNGSQYGYGWQEQIFPNAPYAAPVVHSFYHTKNPGKRGEADVRCLISVEGTGYAQLMVDPRSEAAVFGTSLTGQTVDLMMQCNATLSQIKKPTSAG